MFKNFKGQDKWINKNSWPASQFARRVYLFIKNKKLVTFLDLGCGGGRDSAYFSQKGYDVTAVDIIKSGDQQKKLNSQKIKFIKSDIQKLKFKPESFDIIYAHLSLHYFDDKTTTQIFEKLNSILKPRGFLFIKCKSINDPLYGQGKRIEDNFYNFGHVRHFFSKEYMQEKLHNFKIIKISKTNTFKNPGKASFIEAFAQKID